MIDQVGERAVQDNGFGRGIRGFVGLFVVIVVVVVVAVVVVVLSPESGGGKIATVAGPGPGPGAATVAAAAAAAGAIAAAVWCRGCSGSNAVGRKAGKVRLLEVEVEGRVESESASFFPSSSSLFLGRLVRLIDLTEWLVD